MASILFKEMIILLKVVVTFSLLIFLFYKGSFSFDEFFQVLKNPLIYLIGTIGLVTNILLITKRLQIILNLNSNKKISFINVLKFSWIGQFFNTIIPGMVSGDLVKLYYITKINDDLGKSKILVSIFIDRVIGVLGLSFVAGFFSFLFFFQNQSAKLSVAIHPYVAANIVLFISGLIFFGILFAPQKVRIKAKNFIEKIPFVGKKLGICLDAFFSFKDISLIIKILFISIVAQSIYIAVFYYLISSFIPLNSNLVSLFLMIPIGLIFTAIPISPGGAGVGHAFYDYSFALIGIAKGASLYNIPFIIAIFINLFGSFFYITQNSKVTLEEIKNSSL
jgi:uncharacterized membrane protein YbhN (UPF0104 family)